MVCPIKIKPQIKNLNSHIGRELWRRIGTAAELFDPCPFFGRIIFYQAVRYCFGRFGSSPK